ncbi:MAG: SDR family oxidoreductase [Leucobacter sp.]
MTGAAGSLGSDICRALAGSGARIAVHHLDTPAEAEMLAKELREMGARAAAVQGDVARESRRIVADAEEALGPIDILVNNAGYMDERPMLETPLEIWQRTLDIDLTGVFLMCQAALPGMTERGRGSIINVSSQLAFKGGLSVAPYCAAKAGVVGLTRAMAREFGPAIRVTAVAPGPLETAMTRPFADEEWLDARTSGLIIGRLGQTHEVAPVVAFLAGDGAALLNGQVIHCNGGGVMQ